MTTLKIEATIKYIRGILGYDSDLLFQWFMQHDLDKDALLSEAELLKTLKSFGIPQDAKTVAQAIAKDCAEKNPKHGGKVTFGALFAWLEEAKLSKQISGGKLAWYFVRDVSCITADATVNVFMCGTPGIIEMDEEKGKTLLMNLEEVYFDVSLCRARARARQLEAEERFRLQYSVHSFTLDQIAVVDTVFKRAISDPEKGELYVETDLPKVASLLGYPLTHDDRAMTRVVYGESMTFQQFLVWWSHRHKQARI
eukprot:PhM_4_TR14742/c0_g1_i1/m.101435